MNELSLNIYVIFRYVYKIYPMSEVWLKWWIKQNWTELNIVTVLVAEI